MSEGRDLLGPLNAEQIAERSRRRIEVIHAARRPFRPGKPDVAKAAIAKARSFIKNVSPEMASILYDLAKSAEDERVRSVCAIAMLDRAGIRPRDYDPNEDREDASAFNPRAYSPDELDLIERALRLMLERRRGLPRSNGSHPGDGTIDGEVLSEVGEGD